MKKLTILILILSTMFTGAIVYANAGPTYWEGYPSSEILAVEENSPIIIEKENLIFDFTKENNRDYNDYNISGLVTAVYTMFNPSENNETVQMAFPVVGSMYKFNPESIDIEENGETLDFEVFIGDTYDEGQVDFQSIVKQITASEYSPQYYDLEETGTLYTFDITKTSNYEINILIEYSYDDSQSRVMFNGFDGFGSNDNDIRLTTWVYETMEIFVLGEDIDFNITAYTDGEMKNETEAYSLDVTTEEIPIGDYIDRQVEVFNTSYNYSKYLAGNQIFNLFTRQLDKLIENNANNLDIRSISAFDHFERFFVLVYEVDFLPQDTVETSISYNTFSTMDRRETSKPIHSFDYILNPAENWADFSNLDIMIKPHEDYPYILSSSEEFTRNEDGTYTATFETLPEKNLSFSLYDKEEVTKIDKIKGFSNRNSYFIAGLLPIVGIIGMIIGVIVYRKSKKS